MFKKLEGGLKPRKLNIREPEIGIDLAKAQEQAMRAVALGLDETFNGDLRGEARQVGFVLLVFPFGTEVGDCNYISNGSQLQDMKRFFEFQVARLTVRMEEETKQESKDGN